MRKQWMDSGLPIEERAELLLRKMSAAEKIGQTRQARNVSPEQEPEVRAGEIGAYLTALGLRHWVCVGLVVVRHILKFLAPAGEFS